MNRISFTQKSSVTKRLRSMLLAVAVFFVLEFLGILVSSQNYLKGLTTIDRANRVLELSTRATESLDVSAQSLAKLSDSKKVGDARYTFLISIEEARRATNHAIDVAPPTGEVLTQLNQAASGLQQYQASAEVLFRDIKSASFKGESLVATEYEKDIRESLRKAQIGLTKVSNEEFAAIYQNRYFPLTVAIILAAVFFSFVAVIGFSVVRRLERSLRNLSDATDAVRRQDLEYRAPILFADELGKLTAEFNQMAGTLHESHGALSKTVGQLSRLQSVTAAFSEALHPDQVAETTVREGFEATGAAAGVLALASEDKTKLEFRRIRGYSDDVHSMKYIAVDSNRPVAEAFRLEQPVWVEGPAYYAKYSPDVKPPYPFFAAIPLVAAGKVFGVLGLSFKDRDNFSDSEKNFMIALARQCAQALARAQFYQDSQDAIRIRDQFLSIASHELRTPITSLKLQLQVLMRHIQVGTLNSLSPEKLMRILESSDRQIGRLVNLIEDLLDVSRISLGKLSLNREQVNLRDMIRELVNQLSAQFVSAGMPIEVNAELPIVGNLDRLRIEQVIVNLMTNALKYAPGKPVKISLGTNEKGAVLEVKDNGKGIAPEDRERIFDRFERVNERDNLGGLGLGLYISRQIVEAHGGRIYVTGNSGEGATFVMEVPLGLEKGMAVPGDGKIDVTESKGGHRADAPI